MLDRHYAVNFVVKDENDTSSIEYQRGVIPSQLLQKNHERCSTECLPYGDERFDINVYSSKNLNLEVMDEITTLSKKGSCIALDIVDHSPSVLHSELINTVSIFIGHPFFHYRSGFICQETSFPRTFEKGISRTYKRGEKLNLFWFGDDSEKIFLKHIKKNQVDYHGNFLYKCSKKTYNSKYCIPWDSLMSPQVALREMHCTLLPHGTSPWRVIDAIYSGTFVIMDEKEPIFKAFKRYGYYGNLNDGIEFYKTYPDEVRKRIYDGQKFIENNYKDSYVYQEWKKALLLE